MIKRVKLRKLLIVALTILLFLCLSAAVVGIYAYGNENVAQAAEITAPKTLEELREADPYEVAKLSYFDGRQYGYLTPVRYQPSRTCWAHATIGAIEASILREGIDPGLNAETFDLSEHNMAWQNFNRDGSVDPLGNTPSYIYSDDNWNRGYSLRAGITPILQWAAPIQTDGKDDFRFAREGEVKYVVKDIIDLSFAGKEVIKEAIVKYGGITMGFNAYNLHAESIYYSGIRASRYEGHACVIVGWDDDIPAEYFKGGEQPQNNGGWLIRNSWGTNYHDQGYFWLSYDCGLGSEVFAFDMGLKSDYDNNYYYDGSCDNMFISNNNVNDDVNPVKAAAIYEAKCGIDKVELVKGANVGIYSGRLESVDITVRVDFYKNVTADKNDRLNVEVNLPESGEHVATVTRTVHRSGFYYIALDEKDWFDVDKGSYFSAVVSVYNGMLYGCREDDSDSVACSMTYKYNYNKGLWSHRTYDSESTTYTAIPSIKCYTVLAEDISKSEISLEKDSYIYTGSAYEPSVTVIYENKVLTSADYTVSYVNNINAGEASVIVRGIGDYAGNIIKSFIIKKAESPVFSFEDMDVKIKNGKIIAPDNAKYLSDIPLPEWWEWQKPDSKLIFNMSATAVYIGDDKDNYENLTKTLRIKSKYGDLVWLALPAAVLIVGTIAALIVQRKEKKG